MYCFICVRLAPFWMVLLAILACHMSFCIIVLLSLLSRSHGHRCGAHDLRLQAFIVLVFALTLLFFVCTVVLSTRNLSAFLTKCSWRSAWYILSSLSSLSVGNCSFHMIHSTLFVNNIVFVIFFALAWSMLFPYKSADVHPVPCCYSCLRCGSTVIFVSILKDFYRLCQLGERGSFHPQCSRRYSRSGWTLIVLLAAVWRLSLSLKDRFYVLQKGFYHLLEIII